MLVNPTGNCSLLYLLCWLIMVIDFSLSAQFYVHLFLSDSHTAENIASLLKDDLPDGYQAG